jgi:hypothetical protein
MLYTEIITNGYIISIPNIYTCLQNREISNWEAHLIILLKMSVFIIVIVIYT